MALLRGFVSRIVFRMQISAGRGDGSVPEIVPHEPQVHLLVGHMRARGMA